MKPKTSKKALLTTAVMGASLLTISAWAGGKIFDPFDGVFTVLSGSYETNANNNADPFVLQIFSAGNECVRLAVFRQGVDLEMTLVSPDGRVWQNDDGGGSAGTRPLIKAITTRRGWHPLILSHFAGSPANGDFRLIYGRFSVNTNQCANATRPDILFNDDLKGSSAKGSALNAEQDSGGMIQQDNSAPNANF